MPFPAIAADCSPQTLGEGRFAVITAGAIGRQQCCRAWALPCRQRRRRRTTADRPPSAGDAVLLCLLQDFATMSVAGIDVGDSTSCIALARKGGELPRQGAAGRVALFSTDGWLAPEVQAATIGGKQLLKQLAARLLSMVWEQRQLCTAGRGHRCLAACLLGPSIVLWRLLAMLLADCAMLRESGGNRLNGRARLLGQRCLPGPLPCPAVQAWMCC